MITDDYGKPIEFSSRSHKAQVLASQNLKEAGDTVGGARVGSDIGNNRRGTFVSNNIKHFEKNPVTIQKSSFKTRATAQRATAPRSD